MTRIPDRPKRPPIVLAESDRDRLRALVRACAGTPQEEDAEMLSGEIERAEVVANDEIQGDVVTLNSAVRFEDRSTGRERDVTLVLPAEAAPLEGRISVLAPVGAALLGLRVGQSIQWDLPNGRTTELLVRAVAQPKTVKHAAAD